MSKDVEKNKENTSPGPSSSQEEPFPSTSKDQETYTVCKENIDFVIEKKHIWRYSETVALIKSMESHYEKFEPCKKEEICLREYL